MMGIASAGIGKRLARTVLAIFLLLLVVLGIEITASRFLGYPPILGFFLHELPFRGQSFDPDAWAYASVCEERSVGDCVDRELACPRGPMLNDLLTRHLVVDVTSQDAVTVLLGPREYEVEIRGQTCDAYYLGWCSGFRLDPDSLYVCYGENGSISSAGHIQH